MLSRGYTYRYYIKDGKLYRSDDVFLLIFKNIFEFFKKFRKQNFVQN